MWPSGTRCSGLLKEKKKKEKEKKTTEFVADWKGFTSGYATGDDLVQSIACFED